MTAALELSTTSHVLSLQAPLSGCIVPIEQVPDPVFAQKMVGDGIALDPVSQSLRAPCDGEVIMLHPANHALTLRVAGGVELLLHIGLDTVNLKGAGFTPKVKTGDRVHAGDSLIDFDADFIATHAKSLLSMILVSNPERVKSLRAASGSVVAVQDTVLELELIEQYVDEVPHAGAQVTSEPIQIANASGLHARPAAVLANTARSYVSEIWLQRGDRRANAKSVTALMGLDVRHDDTINLMAEGPDAEQAVHFLSGLIVSGLGEQTTPAPAPAPAPAIATLSPAPRADDPNLLLGLTASRGLAVGNAFQLRREKLEVPETAQDPDDEQRKLDAAINTARGLLAAASRARRPPEQRHFSTTSSRSAGAAVI